MRGIKERKKRNITKDFLTMFIGLIILVLGACSIYDFFVLGVVFFLVGTSVSILGGYRFLTNDTNDEEEKKEKKNKFTSSNEWHLS